MSMTKQQMVGAVCGGVFVVCAGALGWFLYDAATQRAEAEEQLVNERDAFTRFNESAVFPSKKSIADVKSNETSYAEWHAAALALAARGDRPAATPEEPSVFKQRLQAEVRRLSELPGSVEGKICANGFFFGFEQYLGESGVLPQTADVPRLAVQLDTISRVVDMFAAAGVCEVKSVQRIEAKADEDEEAPRAKKKGAKKVVAEDGDSPKTTCLEYALEFTVRPSAFVKVFNGLTADTRFCVVRNVSFKQSSDTILDRLAAVEAAAAQAASASQAGARRRRRGASAQQDDAQKKPEEKKVDRLVSDPETDAPVLVSLTLAVYDFGMGAQPTKPTAEESVPEKKEEKK